MAKLYLRLSYATGSTHLVATAVNLRFTRVCLLQSAWIWFLFQGPHVYISTHFYEMLNIRDHLFGENDSKIEYLTFEYLFEEDSDTINTPQMNNLTLNEIHEKKIIFLYKIKQGITKSSFAINIAKRAGLPEKITKRATQLLKIFDENTDQDEDVLSEKKDPEQKFKLLSTPESEADGKQ